MADKDTVLQDLSPQQRERLYELLKRKQKKASARGMKLRRGEKKLFPLSFGQERLWFLDQLQPESPFYNLPGALRLQGGLDRVVLQKSLSAIVQRHEMLRTLFVAEYGYAQQYIQPFQEVELPVCDLTSLPSAQREAEIERLIQREACTPFNLATGPLLRMRLLQLDVEEHVLLLTMHHIVSDAWSIGLLIRELSEFYTALVEGRAPMVSPLPVQYVDFALWQREWWEKGEGRSQLEYWKQQLRDIPLLALPTDHPRPVVQRYQGASLTFCLSDELSQQLKELSQREGVTLFMTLLAAFQVLLARYSGQEDIAVGTPIANRTHAEIEGLIGFFVNTLVLRTDLSGRPSFREVLQRVKKVALGAYTNQDFPFELLVEALQPERDLGRNPLFQVLFQLDNTPVIPLTFPGITLSLLKQHTTTAKFDLTLYMMESEDRLVGTVEYNTDLFETETIQRLLGHWQKLLQSVVAKPEFSIARLELLTEPEQELLQAEWASTTVDYPKERCLHELFEEQVQRAPEAIALVFDQQQMTYEQLNARSNQLAHLLQTRGIGPESLVGVYLQPSPAFVLALLAILKAGGVYVPLDPTYPQERLDFMLHDAQIRVLLTQQDLLERLPAHTAQTICLDTAQEDLSAQATENLQSRLPGSALAYVIYTSGSTGTPKGVAIPHQAVTRLVLNTNYIQIRATDRLAQASNTAFDAAIFEIWGPLLHGASLIGLSRETLLSPPALVAALQERHITILFVTTALFNQVIQEVPAAFHSLTYLLFGGEAVTPKWVGEALAQGRPEHLLHFYGPTENTTFSTWYPVEAVPEGATTLPIGFPVANTQGYVLDRQMQPVPSGVVGELYLGGDGLARGYLGRAEVTAEHFVPHPSSSEPGARLYRTGDQVFFLADGAIVFVGRRDQQVKIRGFRIELGEIAAVLAQHPAVQENVVIAHEERLGTKRLVAYIAVASGSQTTNSELRHFLQEKLPEYMVPSAFFFLETLPLTPSGKLDRRRLPVPDFSAYQLDTPFVAPRDALELQLALLWEEVLQVSFISITANFFDLGGHSLLAVQLMAGIEQRFGQRLPLTVLFQEATIERLAVVLRQKQIPHKESPLVGLQTSGAKHPFFLVHAGGGSVFCYVTLARYLGKDQPVYGLQTPGLYDDREPCTDLQELAVCYIQQIRAVQPEGPYHLGGWCGGGIIAYEMARQLQDAGQKVAPLLLLDSAPPCTENAPERDDMLFLLAGFAGDLLHLLGEQMPISYKRALLELLISVMSVSGNQAANTNEVTMLMAYLLAEHQKLDIMTLSESLKQLTPDQRWQRLVTYAEETQANALNADLAHLRRLYLIYSGNARAIHKYIPQAYSGKIVLFYAIDKEVDKQREEALAWQTWTTEHISLHSVPGDHYTMLKEPNVQILAEKLKEQLELSR